MTSVDNHTLTVEMERSQKIFEWCDGVNGADPLTIIYPITLSISVPSFYNSSISWIVNKILTSSKGFSTALKPRLCSSKKKRKKKLPCSINILLPSVSTFMVQNSFFCPYYLEYVFFVFFIWIKSMFWIFFLYFFTSIFILQIILWIKQLFFFFLNDGILQLCLYTLLSLLLTHGWALPTAPRSTLSSEQGNLSLQHFHPGDKLLDCGCCWTTTRSFWDVDAVGERYLKDNKYKLALIKHVGAIHSTILKQKAVQTKM